MRGLKLVLTVFYEDKRYVAPLVGAWIETNLRTKLAKFNFVAPLVGAWIETADIPQTFRRR